MYKVKKYIISLGVMLLGSMVSLLIVSTLTYIFKWQADMAMIGIIAAYVITGMIGGVVLGHVDKKRVQDEVWNSREKRSIKQIMQVVLLVFLYVLLVMFFSGILFKMEINFSKQTVTIIFLLFGSGYMGRILVK